MSRCFVVVHDLLPAQPVQQVGAIRGLEDFPQGIGFFRRSNVTAGREQVQVVVAQYAHQGIAQAI